MREEHALVGSEHQFDLIVDNPSLATKRDLNRDRDVKEVAKVRDRRKVLEHKLSRKDLEEAHTLAKMIEKQGEGLLGGE